MRRRRFLAFAAAGTAGIAGCSSGPERRGTEPETRATATATMEEGSGGSDRRSPAHRDTIFVGPDGARGASGARDDPIASIQEGFERAGAGQTVRALPGRYHERVETVRPGEPGDPIVLTGPPEAVFVGGDETPRPEPLKILHSHVHVLGLTFDGLQDPDHPDRVSKDAPGGSAYAGGNVQVNPFSAGAEDAFPGYVRDVKVKPHAVGNVLGAMINVFFAHDVEIGEFQVIGPAGIQHLKGDRDGHNGEVVYLGTPPDKFGGSGTDVSGATVDESSGIHVHHVDNSAGHPHAELVDVKAGCTDVTIEYCTDLGGAGRYTLPGQDATAETAFHLGGNDTTLRWNVVEDSHGQAVEVGSWGATHPEDFEEGKGFPFPEAALDSGRSNAIYGNRFSGNAGLAIRYPIVYPEDGESHVAEGYGPDAQRVVCGNEFDGDTHGEPGAACPDSIPGAETIGHLGGESPWA